MSYIPNYLHEVDKLNETDKAFVEGFKAAQETVENFFDDKIDEEVNEGESVKDCLDEWLTMNLTEYVCAFFEGDEYDDLELTDGNEPLFTGTKGVKAEKED